MPSTTYRVDWIGNMVCSSANKYYLQQFTCSSYVAQSEAKRSETYKKAIEADPPTIGCRYCRNAFQALTCNNKGSQIQANRSQVDWNVTVAVF